MTLDNQVGDFMLTKRDIDYMRDYPYGITITLLTHQGEIDVCIGVVRAALKKAKANL